MTKHKHTFEPPTSAEQLDALMRHIDAGDGDLASLSDEQRAQLKNELNEAWLEDHLGDYPVPADIAAAAAEYQAIESGDKYPSLPDHVRLDLLLQFEEHHGEGGPQHWRLHE